MDLEGKGLEAAWFGDRWVLAAGNSSAVSLDGVRWSAGQDGAGLTAEERYVTSLTAGPDSIMATTCGGWGPHDAWYSEDGLEWNMVSSLPGPHSGYAYSDELGFVVVSEGGERVLMSPDGREWTWTTERLPLLGPDGGISGLAVSGTSVFVLADQPFVLTPERP